MTVSAPDYSARFELPVILIEHDRDSTLFCPVYSGGSLVTPTAATVTVYNASGEIVVDAAAATIVGDIPQYTIPAAVTTDQAKGYGWRVLWSVDFTHGHGHNLDTHAHIFDHDAALCRRVAYSVVTDADLYRRCPYLDRTSAGAITREATMEPWRQEAWLTIQHRLLQAGRRPWLIIDSASLREPEIALALALIHEALAIRGAPQLQERAEMYRQQFESSFGRISLRYDLDDDGDVDEQRAAVGILWLGSTPSRKY